MTDDELSDLRAIIHKKDEEIAKLKEENKVLDETIDTLLERLKGKER